MNDTVKQDKEWTISLIEREITYNENKASTHKAEMEGALKECIRLRLLRNKKTKELKKS